MKESTKEFIGITPASLLATLGFVFVFINVLYFDIALMFNNVLSILGIVATSTGIYINFKKRDKIEWRGINKIIHIGMLLTMIIAVILHNIFST